MQLGKTGFIQLRLSPEFYSWLWVVLFGPILQNIASKSEKRCLMAIGQNCPNGKQNFQTLVYWKRDLLDNMRLSCVPAVSTVEV